MSDPDLSSNKDLRLREVKCLCQGHTATHQQSRKREAPGTAERDSRLTLSPAAERGTVQGQEQQPLSPCPPLEQTAVLLRENNQITCSITLSLGGDVPEAACRLVCLCRGMWFLELVSSRCRRQEGAQVKHTGLVPKVGSDYRSSAFCLRSCATWAQTGPVTSTL